MTKINARSKGSGGEREFCSWLFNKLALDEKPQRNLEQVRSGGTDIIMPPFGFEVKRCEKLQLTDWWIQVKTDCAEYNKNIGETSLEPVVAFRQNGKPWEFLISAYNIGCTKGFLRINEKVFLEWALRFVL